MPITQMRNGLTAENSIFSQKPNVKVSRSKFDLGRLNCFTSDIGMIVPVDLIPTLPGDIFNLSCQYKIDFRPLLVPTLTAYKVKLHYYYCPNEYLWSGWESFISKGRSGKLSLTVPQIKVSLLNSLTQKLPGLTDSLDGTISDSPSEYLPYSVHSLLGYMIGSVPYHPTGDTGLDSLYLPYIKGSVTPSATGYKAVDTSALPFVMYQKIYRSNYMDPNLYSNGKMESQVWFPDDIDSSDWRLSYNADNLGGTANCFFVPQRQSIPANNQIVANFVPYAQDTTNSQSIYDNAVNLTQLRYSMYTDDMFTTALPFLQRGPQTSLDLSSIVGQIPLERLDSSKGFGFGSSVPGNVNDYPMSFLVGPNVGAYQLVGTNSPSNSNSVNTSERNAQSDAFNGVYFGSSSSPYNLGVDIGSIKATFTAQQLRDLLAISVWQERNALTNGSYGQFIRVHFDSSPKNTWCEPIYIGGTTSVFNVNSVVQTSESGITPQGTQTGIGGSSNGDNLGTFTASDFGYIMALMTIIPDNTYVQTQDHWQFDSAPDDFYMPEYENLSYQPILNKQLAYFGDDSVANDLFGYSNRYVYLKQREGITRGMFSLPASIDAYYHSYVQSRVFSSTPKLSQQFVTVFPPNIDRSFLAYPGQPAFLVQYYSGISVVRALSYASQPNTFGF